MTAQSHVRIQSIKGQAGEWLLRSLTQVFLFRIINLHQVRRKSKKKVLLAACSQQSQ